MKRFLGVLLFLLYMNLPLFAGFTQMEILSPEEAFKVESKQSDNGVDVTIKLAKTMYIYDDKLHIEIISPIQVSLDKEVKKPKPVSFHDFIVHRKDVDINIPNSIISKYVKDGDFTIKVSYQGCSERGLCYQPMNNTFTYKLKKDAKIKKDEAQSSNLSEEDAIAGIFKDSGFFMILLTFFGFGLLLSLTPCIFPMIPILSSVIVSKSDENMSTKRAFFLSLVYVLAMSVAYTIAGVLAGLFGANIQTAMQNPWVLGVFSLIFVLLSLSMFGFYELQMPSFIQSKLTKKSDESAKNGSIIGVAIMGFLSALIVGPCVAAPLAGALVYIGQSGDALLGGAALFVMSLGMGVPLLIIGAGAGKFMPRPGVWMDSIKNIFGVMMLGVAIWMLSRVIPPNITMLLWMVLLLVSSIYLGALEPLKEGASGWKKLFKGFGLIMFIYSLMLFVGAMSGVTNPLKPLVKLGTSSVVVDIKKEGIPFKRVITLKELESVVKTSKKPVMIDFYADWCVSCKELEEYTFSDPKVKELMKSFTLLQVDVTKNSKDDKELLKRFGVFGPPAIIFFKENKELKSLKIVGFKNAKFFAKHLEKVLRDALK